MTTTYTIAMCDDILVATAPDGDKALMEKRLAAMDDQLSPGWRDRIAYTSGLTLIDFDADDIEGAEVIYSGTDCGWLEDAAGNMHYRAAVRVAA
jgi:hypothetical protein